MHGSRVKLAEPQPSYPSAHLTGETPAREYLGSKVLRSSSRRAGGLDRDGLSRWPAECPQDRARRHPTRTVDVADPVNGAWRVWLGADRGHRQRPLSLTNPACLKPGLDGRRDQGANDLITHHEPASPWGKRVSETDLRIVHPPSGSWNRLERKGLLLSRVFLPGVRRDTLTGYARKSATAPKRWTPGNGSRCLQVVALDLFRQLGGRFVECACDAFFPALSVTVSGPDMPSPREYVCFWDGAGGAHGEEAGFAFAAVPGTPHRHS